MVHINAAVALKKTEFHSWMRNPERGLSYKGNNPLPPPPQELIIEA